MLPALGFLALATFFGMNGHELTAADAEVVTELVALASGGAAETTLAAWIREHIA